MSEQIVTSGKLDTIARYVRMAAALHELEKGNGKWGSFQLQ